jgi:hypothetical protein
VRAWELIFAVVVEEITAHASGRPINVVTRGAGGERRRS